MEGNFSVRPQNAEHAIFENNVRITRFKHPGSETSSLPHYLVGRELERRSPCAHGPLRKASTAKNKSIGVALEHTNLVQGQAQPLGDHLREHGFMALSGGQCANKESRRTIWRNPNFHPLGRRAGALAVHSDSDTAPHTSLLGVRP